MLNLETLEKLKRLPALLDEGRDAVAALAKAASDLRVVTRGFYEREKEEITPTFVYVLPVSGPFLAQRSFVPAGKTVQLVFNPYAELAPGAWVVSVGSALVGGVKVGNLMQASMSDYQGHVCKTVDPCPVGCHLIVELDG